MGLLKAGLLSAALATSTMANADQEIDKSKLSRAADKVELSFQGEAFKNPRMLDYLSQTGAEKINNIQNVADCLEVGEVFREKIEQKDRALRRYLSIGGYKPGADYTLDVECKNGDDVVGAFRATQARDFVVKDDLKEAPTSQHLPEPGV